MPQKPPSRRKHRHVNTMTQICGDQKATQMLGSSVFYNSELATELECIVDAMLAVPRPCRCLHHHTGTGMSSTGSQSAVSGNDRAQCWAAACLLDLS